VLPSGRQEKGPDTMLTVLSRLDALLRIDKKGYGIERINAILHELLRFYYSMRSRRKQ